MGLLGSKNNNKEQDNHEPAPRTKSSNNKPAVAPNNLLVLHRLGSQFFDADGDLAHEFYEQVSLADGRTTMRRVTQGLRHQGLVALETPRLHPDCPCVLLML
ncbi:tumor suppressor candidate 2-like [Neocloeon triangulifer]|uniref:tumor suppressor candidate 2-like n=1 Tax=Neocloeon triangulifer TaxID=2078957 RepID=UPI00286EE90E|nr:tumor suppressor candidate 2-like [Neocloeon triangulifer]